MVRPCKTIDGYGNIVSVAGAVLHVLKCKNLEAKLTELDHCTIDVPVKLVSTNETMYIHPVTRVLKETSSTLPCEDSMNPYFEIRGLYYKMTPTLQHVPKPNVFPTNIKEIISNGIESEVGLYPHELISKMETGWLFTSKKRDAENRLLNFMDEKIGHGGKSIVKLSYIDNVRTSVIILSTVCTVNSLLICLLCLCALKGCRNILPIGKSPEIVINTNINNDVGLDDAV